MGRRTPQDATGACLLRLRSHHSDSIPPIACLGGWWLGTSPPQKPRSEMKVCLLIRTRWYLYA
jgi:hypothetical protein